MSSEITPSVRTAAFALVALVLSCVLVASPVAHASSDTWTTRFVEARATASTDDKDLLMLFTGSDWCPPCMALESEILDQSAFSEPMATAFVPVLLDFPSGKPQPDATRQQNGLLQTRYQIQGYPTILLTDAMGQVYAKLGYDAALAEQGPAAYAAHLIQMREIRHTRDAAFAQAQAVQGVERARALDRGLEAVGPELAAAFYSDVLNDVVLLDPDDQAGLKSKYQRLLSRQFLERDLDAAVQRLQSGDLSGGLNDIDAMIGKYAPQGEILQVIELVRAQAFTLLDKPAQAREAFERSIAAAPHSPSVPDIRTMMEQPASQ